MLPSLDQIEKREDHNPLIFPAIFTTSLRLALIMCSRASESPACTPCGQLHLLVQSQERSLHRLAEVKPEG